MLSGPRFPHWEADFLSSARMAWCSAQDKPSCPEMGPQNTTMLG